MLCDKNMYAKIQQKSKERGKSMLQLERQQKICLLYTSNDTLVGTWTSPGDYGDVRGMFTPEWWPQNWNQYGLLKLFYMSG